MSWVENEGPENPRAFLQAITLPVDQVLEILTSVSQIQDAADSISRVRIDELGGWKEVARTAQRTFRDGFHLGDMECRMNAHGRRYLESDSGEVDDFLYGLDL